MWERGRQYQKPATLPIIANMAARSSASDLHVFHAAINQTIRRPAIPAAVRGGSGSKHLHAVSGFSWPGALSERYSADYPGVQGRLAIL